MQDYGARIKVSHQGQVTVVELLDEEILEEGPINEITDALFTVVQNSANIKLLLSFDKVKHFSSSALGMLIRLNKRVGENGGALRLCRIKPSLYEIFTITKLNKLFDIHDRIDKALKGFD